MDPPRTDMDCIVAQIEKLQHELDVLKSLAMPVPSREEVAADAAAHSQDPPVDGQTRPGQIWLHDRWCSLSPQRLRLLAYAMGEGIGATWEEVCRYMDWTAKREAVDSPISKLNVEIKKEMGRAPRWPEVSMEGGLHCEWSESRAKSKNRA